jgi:hypothetical protein
MTAAERRRKYHERRKADEQEIRNENLRLRRKSKRLRSKSSLETEERRMSLINALRRVPPNVAARVRSSCAAGVVPRPICVAKNQQPRPLIRCGTTPGGRQILPTLPGEDRAGSLFLLRP